MQIFGVATVFLKCDNKYLLMKRSALRKHYPNVWDGVGGGIKGDELIDPDKAAIREIYEETGIVQKNISDLNLKYIHTALHPNGGLTQHYIYFADVDTFDVWQTDEGDLSWVENENNELLEREFSPVMDSLLRHYFTLGKYTGDVYIFSTHEGKITITPFGQDNE